MTCRHGVDDPSCSSYRTPEQRLIDLEKQKEQVKQKYGLSDTPDASNFQVIDSYEIGKMLVLKVEYPSCKNCSYEGVKVMVFEGVGLKQAIKWKKIDPHFRDEEDFDGELGYAAAPGPVARFPASERGWNDAITYANSKRG